MTERESLLYQKNHIDDEIGFLFYVEDLEDRLSRIRQAIEDIDKTGHIQSTADEHIDTYMWSTERTARVYKSLQKAEKLYTELIDGSK